MSATSAAANPTVVGVQPQRASLRWAAWAGDGELPITFPGGWHVASYAPHDAPSMSAAEIADAIAHPIGTPPLRELARGRQRPCIVIDDLSRPTQGAALIPPILDELAAAGIDAADVLVLAAVANHRPMLHDDLERKLGADVLGRCQVANHFSGGNCTLIGTTSLGTPVEVNTDFLASDLRILVGSIIPHAAAGFSGGAKLLLPGIASIAAAEAYHRGPALQGAYNVDEPPARADSEEAARMCLTRLAHKMPVRVRFVKRRVM
jgi:nickel-dependent lactate racemase